MQNGKHPMVSSEYDKVWQKYCGFFDLSIEQAMLIQETLLLQQLEQISSCPLGEKLLGKKIPKNIDEFRYSVPLTTYQDYLPEFDLGIETVLPEKPSHWAHTSDASGTYKRVPYTPEFYNRTLDNLMAAFVLACAKDRGISSIAENDRVLFNVAPKPYISGILAEGASERFNLKPVIESGMHDSLDFKEKVTKGFEVSLRNGVDILIAMTSVLVKTGNDFNQYSKKRRLSKNIVSPGVLYRYARAYILSKLEQRGILPKDLWPVKAVIGWGIDTSIYREHVMKHWGIYPYEFYACTEGGIMAMQSWNKKHMTFIPSSNFFEFIPEMEWLQCKYNTHHQPSTVLLSEVEPGQRYELVITSFHGMPFIRYRLGHLVKIMSLSDKETNVSQPQIIFETRADDLIDIAGFTRLSEKSVAQAIANAGLNYEDWSIRKEIVRDKPTLHLYIELHEERDNEEIKSILQHELTVADPGYHDLAKMMEIHPLEVTLLPRGAFSEYYRIKKESGAELTQRRPPRMNAPDYIIRDLLRQSSNQLTYVR